MDWITLVNLLVSPIMALCGLTIGLIMGAVGTILVHTTLINKQRQMMLEDQERQRERDLDDQRRNWEKERLTRLLAQVNSMSSLVYQTGIVLEEGKEPDVNNKIQELKDTLSQIDSSFDDELDRLFEDFNDEIFSALRTKETDILKERLFHTRQRINVLLANCYK